MINNRSKHRSMLIINEICHGQAEQSIGHSGYDIIKTRKGKGACVSIATAYEDVFLDTFNLEIDLKPTVKISRHNIPPFIPLNNLAEQNNMQTDLRVFLDTLSKHLNAFAGRKQQLKLVKVPDFTFLNYISPYPSVADVDSIMSVFWEGKAICCRTPCLGAHSLEIQFQHSSRASCTLHCDCEKYFDFVQFSPSCFI
uniref:Centromere protein O n=1 Tax=Haplochromis burtoni TaxID=8153 RepID=A0A3Q2W2K4_HAPBU